jgi:hypothetical protein
MEISSMIKGFLLFLFSLCYLGTFGQIPMISFDKLESWNFKGSGKKINLHHPYSKKTKLQESTFSM